MIEFVHLRKILDFYKAKVHPRIPIPLHAVLLNVNYEKEEDIGNSNIIEILKHNLEKMAND